MTLRLSMLEKESTLLSGRSLTKMTMWSDSNKLTIVADICEAFQFGSDRLETIVIKNRIPFYESKCKYLALHIDPLLSFRDLRPCCKKLNEFCGLLYHVRHFYSRKCLLAYFHSFAISITCSLVLHGISAKNKLRKDGQFSKTNSSF